MPQFPWLDPAPFFLPGGPVGCLLIHGFTGSPPEMRPMGEYLAQRGIAASAPLLAGHGTTPQDLARTTWHDWYSSVETAFLDLRKRSEVVFVGGFSLGALLAMHLAANQDVSGLILMSPALVLRDSRVKFVPVVRLLLRFVTKDPDPSHTDLTDPEAYKKFWSYDAYPTAAMYQLYLLQKVVRPELPRIHAPALIAYSTGDMAVSPRSGEVIRDGISSQHKEMLVLHNSGHGIVVDSECLVLFEKAYAWIAAHRGS